jgi:hypothetical protein
VLETVRRQLTYANVMATLAVFIALGGTSYAVVTINGGRLKNRSVRAVKIARDTLTGSEIRESRLGKVPQATNSDRLAGLTAAQLKVRCPSATLPFADVCVETSPRAPAAYGSAVLECAAADTPASPGRRLPTHGELTRALSALTLAAGGELTSDVYPSSSDPGRLDVLYVTDRTGRVGVTPDTGAGAKPFRCVADPLN